MSLQFPKLEKFDNYDVINLELQQISNARYICDNFTRILSTPLVPQLYPLRAATYQLLIGVPMMWLVVVHTSLNLNYATSGHAPSAL